jgi:hypothetical protein
MAGEVAPPQPPARPPRRVPVDLAVDFSVAGGPPQAGRVVNLTRTGLFLATATPAPVGTAVALSFAAPPAAGGLPLAAAAEVRWVNDPGAPRAAALPPGMGLKFLGPAPDVWALLRVVVAEQLATLARGGTRPAPRGGR